MTARHLLAAGAVAAAMLGALAPALAQSTRYPPPPVDVDAEQEQYSRFWENAIEPGRDRFDELVDRAAKLIGRRAADARVAAIDLLDEATALLPERAAAWAWRGLAHEERGDLVGCRDDLERAYAIDPTWSGSMRPLLLALGHCRAGAGELDGAVELLERLVARGDERVETLWRVGELYLALGRLDDARAVLEVAVDQSPADPLYAHAAWALTVAADRARDPGATRVAGATALRNDPKLTRVEGPPGGYLVALDADYYRGLAADVAGWPERALVRFRRFLAHDHDGPWATRAREHERALRGFDVGPRVSIEGSDTLDRKKVRQAVSDGDGELRACVRKTPGLLVQLRVTAHGPSEAPPPARAQPPRGKTKVDIKVRVSPMPRPPPPRSPPPPAGVQALIFESHEVDQDAVVAALACVEQVGARLRLPTPSTSGTWATVTVPVIWR